MEVLEADLTVSTGSGGMSHNNVPDARPLHPSTRSRNVGGQPGLRPLTSAVPQS